MSDSSQQAAEASAAAAAAANANATYRAQNGLPADATNTAILNTPQAQQYLAQQDSAREAAKYQAAYSQPRNDLGGQQSAAFLAINAQYAQQQQNSIGSGGAYRQPTAAPAAANPYNPNSAAGIAYDVGLSGGNAAPSVKMQAAAEGYVAPNNQLIGNQQQINNYIAQPAQAIVSPIDRSSNAPTRAENLGYTQYDINAVNLASQRAGYSNPLNLGDSNTRMISQGLGAMQDMGFNVANPNTLNVLNLQRNAARQTPDTTDDRFFMNELQKGVENYVETSSAYHHMGQDLGVPIPANRFEYQGDLAVELLKGAPQKAGDWFSPASGEMSQYLVGGEGLQQYAWRGARDGINNIRGVDFGAGLDKLLSAEGQYGPYNNLYGAPGYRGTPSSQNQNGVQSYQIAALPVGYVPFSSGKVGLSSGLVPETTIGETARITPTSDLPQGYGGFGVNAASNGVNGVEKAGDFGLPRPFMAGGETPTQPVSTIDAIERGASKAFTLTPGGLGIALAMDTLYGGKQSPVGSSQPTYESANKILAPYTTDISGVGSAMKSTPDLPIGNTPDFANKFMNAENTVKNIYIGASQSPLDLAAGYAGGYVVGAGLGLVGRGVAAAASSELPGVGAAGRLASTPVATDLGKLALTGAGVIMVGLAGKNIMDQPTEAGRNQMLGKTAVGFAGFPLGFSSGSSLLPEVSNPYAGRTFSTQEARMGPIESATFKAQTYITSQFTENPSAYRAVASTIPNLRFIEPSVKAEPNFAEASKSGPYANEIRSTLLEQDHAVYGSASLKQQYSPEIVAEAGLRTPKDVDSFINNPKLGTQSLSSKTGLSKEESEGVLDLHNIAVGTPRLKPSTVAEVVEFGNPRVSSMSDALYRNVAAPRTASEIIMKGDTGYAGDVTYESSASQFGRKSGAVALVIERPIETGFRAPKDVYDWVTAGKAQKLTDIARGADASKYSGSDASVEKVLNTELTIGTVKYQKPGDINPTRTVTMRTLFEEQKALNEGDVGNEEIPFGSEYGVKSQGASPYFGTSFGSPSTSASYSSPTTIISSPSPERSSSPSRSYSSQSGSLVSDFSSIGSPSTSERSSPSPLSMASPSIASIFGSDISNAPSPSAPSSPSASFIGSPPSAPSPSSYPTPSIRTPPSVTPSTPSLPPYAPTPSNPRTPTPGLPESPGTPGNPPKLPSGWNFPGSGGSNSDRRKRKRSVELFSFEMGDDSPVPTRFGLGGTTTNFVPGTRGFAGDILNPSDVAPNSLFGGMNRRNNRDSL